MRYTNILAAAMVAPLVAAHGGDIPGAPKVFGLPKDLRRRYPPVAHAIHHEEAPKLEARQGGQGGQCGPNAGGASCDAGFCCSGSGWCGKGVDYCMAPDCLFQYGSGCDANLTPAGASTRNDNRAQKGSIAYGTGIYKCKNPGTVAITYDDGPYTFTAAVLDKFKAAGAKATFFITGNNLGKGAIDTTPEWSNVIRRMVAEGHQVASHTWSHQNLDSITEAQIYDQMVKNEMAIRNILGKYPTYMRPPYSACTSTKCLNIMKTLGYVVSYFDLDTDDYNLLTKEKIEQAKTNFKGGVDTAKSDANGNHRLAIAHDIHQLTAEDLTIYMLQYLKTTGYRAVTMGECMNDPEANWYRTSTPGSTPPTVTTSGSGSSSSAVPTGKVSTDGSCGGANGFSCRGSTFGNCCSAYGWCGATTDHCGTGCNTLFGTCGSSSALPSTSGSTPTTIATTRSASASTPASTGKVSTDGSCAGTNGFTCKGSSYGNCCSSYGWCGATADHCSTGCNPLFGTCGSSSSPPSASVTTRAATSSTRAATSSTRAATSSTRAATTSTRAATSAAPTPTGTVKVSTDASCGGTKGFTCRGSSFGNCCSQYGWCGSTTGHCGTGCNALFGTCGQVSDFNSDSDSSPVLPSSFSTVSTGAPVPTTISSSSADTPTSISVPPSPTAGNPSSTIVTPILTPTSLAVTKNGRCGGKSGQTCSGYKNAFGWAMECCSKTIGYCSNDPWACGLGCDKASGKCWF